MPDPPSSFGILRARVSVASDRRGSKGTHARSTLSPGSAPTISAFPFLPPEPYPALATISSSGCREMGREGGTFALAVYLTDSSEAGFGKVVENALALDLPRLRVERRAASMLLVC